MSVSYLPVPVIKFACYWFDPSLINPLGYPHGQTCVAMLGGVEALIAMLKRVNRRYMVRLSEMI